MTSPNNELVSNNFQEDGFDTMDQDNGDTSSEIHSNYGNQVRARSGRLSIPPQRLDPSWTRILKEGKCSVSNICTWNILSLRDYLVCLYACYYTES